MHDGTLGIKRKPESFLYLKFANENLSLDVIAAYEYLQRQPYVVNLGKSRSFELTLSALGNTREKAKLYSGPPDTRTKIRPVRVFMLDHFVQAARW